MSFLGKIRGMLGSETQPDHVDEPVRNRTFSATQYREEELARAAASRARTEEARIDAAAVLSPAVNPVAETLIAAEDPAPAPELEQEFEQELEVEPEAELEAEPEPEPQPEVAQDLELEPEQELEPEPLAEDEAPTAAPGPMPKAKAISCAPIGDPMPWDEAVGWLSQRSADTRNFVGQYWNWDYDLRVLHFLAQQPDLDAGVAAHIFWLTAACEDYFPFGDDEPAGDVPEQIAWLTDFLGRRFAEGAFRPASYGFDDSWDCERLKERLIELHGEGRLDWSPDAIPTSSQAELMSFDDIPEVERSEVTDFLARFGVY